MKTILTLVICISLLGMFAGCSRQENTTTQETTTKIQESTETQNSRDYLFLQNIERIDISKLENNGGIFDKENNLGYCLMKFSGTINEDTLDFAPSVIEIENENAGFMKTEPTDSDISDNPYPLDSAYVFEEDDHDFDFNLYVKVSVSDEEARRLAEEPTETLTEVQARALEILDDTTLTVSNDAESKDYLLALN